MISQKARYALRALIALAGADNMMIADIAAQQRIPRKFLEQILLDLKRHGIVASRRGRLGGYALLRRPDQITFGRMLRIIDGPIAPLPCLSRIAYRRCPDCKNEATCEIRRVFAGVAESARDVLDRTTIAEAIAGDGLGTGRPRERGRAGRAPTGLTLGELFSRPGGLALRTFASWQNKEVASCFHKHY